MSSMAQFPAYDDLPLITINGISKRCAWGIFDKQKKKDVFGCLNKITPEAILLAAAEVKDGVTISLNWPLRVPRKPGFGRKGLAHKVISFVNSPLAIHGFDDEVEFNTQCSSQWDALCHFYDQDFKRGYNGVCPTAQDLVQDYGNEDKSINLPTLNHWHSRGGLAARGILVDYKAYAARHNIQYSPFKAHKITIETVKDILREQRTTTKPGDVFLLRTGYVEAISEAKTEAEQTLMVSSPDSTGIEDNTEAVRWFWNQHFSAVAADNPGFEVMRPTKNGVDGSGTTADYVLHPNFLALLGLHIGELWDLKALSQYCEAKNRYTFMLTSMPLNYAGACGSPPNAMALF